MFKILNFIITTGCLLFTNCKRNHYYCNCFDNKGPGYDKDWGTQFATKESQLKKDCDSHKVNSNTTCALIGE